MRKASDVMQGCGCGPESPLAAPLAPSSAFSVSPRLRQTSHTLTAASWPALAKYFPFLLNFIVHITPAHHTRPYAPNSPTVMHLTLSFPCMHRSPEQPIPDPCMPTETSGVLGCQRYMSSHAIGAEQGHNCGLLRLLSLVLIFLHASPAKRQGTSCRQDCHNPTPCWTRQTKSTVGTELNICTAPRQPGPSSD